MPKKTIDVEEIEAPHGEKMIEVRLRFFTNEIAVGEGNVIPKHAWAHGTVTMERNPTHGIVPSRTAHYFYSLLDIGAAIEATLIDHGVVLHVSKPMQKYLANSRRAPP